MTIRDLIAQGVDLDAQICVEAHIYDKDGNRTGIYYSYKDIPRDNFIVDDNLLAIVADVNEV